jgi:pSer/pThr/pTyr-binding forkhead associated (FHA) protein
MDFEIPSQGIVLINLENGQMITTQLEKSFILGRASTEIKTTEALVDLTQFGALELGISRVHAMIRQSKGKYQIMDLESSNGTWLENQRLVPKQPYPLESGDRIRIGRLNILVFYLKELKS